MSTYSSKSTNELEFFANQSTVIHLLETVLDGRILPMHVDCNQENLRYDTSKHYIEILQNNMISYSSHSTKQPQTNNKDNNLIKKAVTNQMFTNTNINNNDSSSSSSSSNQTINPLLLPSMPKLEKIQNDADNNSNNSSSSSKKKISINTIISYCWIKSLMISNVEGWRSDPRFLELSKLPFDKQINICDFFGVKGNIFCTWEIICILCIDAYFQTSIPLCLQSKDSACIIIPYNWKYIIEFNSYIQKFARQQICITHKHNGKKFVSVSLEIFSHYVSTIHLKRALESYKCIRDSFY
jgi:hypothetical protein